MLEASNVKLEQMREIIREKDQIIQVRNLKPKPKMANFSKKKQDMVIWFEGKKQFGSSRTDSRNEIDFDLEG